MMTPKSRVAAIVSACAGLAMSSGALAQMATPPSHEVPWRSDSGKVASPKRGNGPEVVYQATVFVPQASWLRLTFSAVELSGKVEEGTGAILRITSLGDGAVQELDAVSAAQWGLTSAYFNGDAVMVELIAHPRATGINRLAISSATAGEVMLGTPDSICGPVDDRILSFDNRTARHSVGCTSWLISDTNHQFLTAGHCGASAGSVMSFNVPLSSAGGSIVQSAPLDQYVVDSGSVQGNGGGSGVGDDWCYFGVFPNSTSGLMPVQAYGAWFTLPPSMPAYAAGQVTRITGYGTTSSPVTPTWSQVQKTHTGPRVPAIRGVIATTVAYTADTTGGNSGSPVIHENGGGVAIGIHTHGYCTSTSGENDGTALNHAGLQNALNNPTGACKTGKGVVGGSLYASGDAVNNFGTCNTTTGSFARVDYGPPRMEGLAYNQNSGLFYGVSYMSPGPSKLYTINPATGAYSLVAPLMGFTGAINGLGYDPVANVLYGVAQSTGQLWVINTSTGAAIIGGTTNSGTNIGALEYDAVSLRVLGIDDAAGGSRLVFFTPATGAVVPIGNLGAGITDCNGLAVMGNGDLYTINAATDQLLKINPATGAATVVGATNGLFGASFGMSAVVSSGTSCYANCDGSSLVPFLNVNDFTCFMNKFAAGDSYANCDASTNPPVLNVNDFSCFNNKFAAGCSAP